MSLYTKSAVVHEASEVSSAKKILCSNSCITGLCGVVGGVQRKDQVASLNWDEAQRDL